MLTLFSIPKPFQGHIGIIQTNAVRSWACLHPDIEVILLGTEAGTQELAAQLKIKYIRDVQRNESGTPLIGSLFEAAQKNARHGLIGYVNADIILLNDFIAAVRQIQASRFLLVGHRWDVDIKEPLDFNNPDTETGLRARVKKEGKLHASSGIDFFIFRRGLYDNVPQFAIGRGGWDNWLVYHACAARVPVIDITGVVTAIHQNHDYMHVSGGADSVWKGPERDRNIELMGGRDHNFTLNDATWLLTTQGLKRALTLRRLDRYKAWLRRRIVSWVKRLSRAVINLISILVHPISKLMVRNKVRILSYHRVCDLPRTGDIMDSLNVLPAVFDKQMSFLSQHGFNIITLEQLVDYKENNTAPPPKTVIITFDDGYRDNFLIVSPILDKYNFKGTFLLVTDYIDSDRVFHWLKLGEKSLAHSKANKQYWQPLTRKDILEMHTHGACFGSHSKSHSYLTQLSQAEVMDELTASRQCLEEILPKPVVCFSYPHGDVNDNVKSWVKMAGYRAALITEGANNTLKSDFFFIPKVC